MARKKWMIRHSGGSPQRQHTSAHSSEAATYRAVEVARSSFRAGQPGAISTLRVYVDEGNGWELYERIDFKEEG